MSNGTQKPVCLAGAQLGARRHACAFFNSKTDEYKVLSAFVLEGFAHGDRVVNIVDPETRLAHRRQLRIFGVDVDDAERSNQLEVCHWDESYLDGGRFDQHRMLARAEEILSEGEAVGFPTTRGWANMEWALEGAPGVEDLVEYEARLNYILPKYDAAVVCVYDLARFESSMVVDILRAHPVAVLGGVLRENPFYVPPDEMLEELRGRAI